MDKAGLNRSSRLFMLAGIVALHSLVYYGVNTLNSLRPPQDFHDFTLIIDHWIPYLKWTWTIYYFGDFYIIFAAAAIVYRLPRSKFIRAVWVYAGMIVSGAVIQYAIPTVAPWPPDLSVGQEFVHNLISLYPYACLPSMHVALTVLPALFLFSVIESRPVRWVSSILAALITLSILTTKEHYFLDMIAGLVLAAAFYGLWRWNPKNITSAKNFEIPED